MTALLSEKPRDTRQRHPDEPALRADRHRQDGLPRPRQPARRRALRPQLRPAAADRQPVPERRRATAWRSADKGKTAAEMMVFARYVMFSEVYWHHARALGDRHAAAGVLSAARPARSRPAVPPDRAGVDRRSSWTAAGDSSGRRAARRPVRPDAAALQAAGPVQPLPEPRPVRAARPPALSVAGRLQRGVRRRRQHGARPPHRAARDAVRRPAQSRARSSSTSKSIFPKENRYRRWAKSRRSSTRWPREQFDDYVKRVRIFVHRGLAEDLTRLGPLDPLLSETLKQMG